MRSQVALEFVVPQFATAFCNILRQWMRCIDAFGSSIQKVRTVEIGHWLYKLLRSGNGLSPKLSNF